MENSLQRTKNELSTTEKPSWKLFLAKKLQLAATVMGKELTTPEVKLWEQVLQGCSEAELDHGFKCFFSSDEAKYKFPVPGQIREQILIWRADKRRASEEQWTQDYLAENRKARETGKTVEFAEIVKALKETVAKMPDITPDRKMALREQLAERSIKKPTETSTVQAGLGVTEQKNPTQPSAQVGEREGNGHTD